MNRNFSAPEAIQTSLSVVSRAAKQGSQSATEIAATELHARCFPQYAPSVVKTPKYLLNLVVISQCTVVIATEKSDRVDKPVGNFRYTWAGDIRPVCIKNMLVSYMSLKVWIHEGESQDSLLRRFQRMVQMDGILREVKAHRHFISKRDAARMKVKTNARRRRRQGNTGAH